MKNGLIRVIIGSFKRPAFAIGFSVKVVILMSPFIYLDRIDAPVEISMMTMFLAPVYLIMNSLTKDIIRHPMIRFRTSRMQRMILTHSISFLLTFSVAISTTAIFVLRLSNAGFEIKLAGFLEYMLFQFLYLYLISSVQNLLTVMFNRRLIAYFLAYFMVISEYIFISASIGSKFVFAYQSVHAIFMQNNPAIYVFLILVSEVLLILSLFYNREEIIK